MLDRFTKEKGVEFTVLIQPDFVTFSLNSDELFAKLPSLPTRFVQPRTLLSLDEAKAASRMYPHLVAFGETEGVSIIDLNTALYEKFLSRSADKEDGTEFFMDGEHLTPEGHEAMAEIIADIMEERFQSEGNSSAQSSG